MFKKPCPCFAWRSFLLCVCPSVCVCPCVCGQNISKSNQSISFLVGIFPVTQGRNDYILKTRGPCTFTLCLGTNLAINKSSRSCTYTLFLPQGVKIELHGQRFPRYGPIFKTATFGYETCLLPKVPEVAHILPFYPIRSKLSLHVFSLYGQQFPRYGPIFKIAIFGHETWPLAKVPEVVYALFLPQGVKIELVFALRSAVFEIRADIQNCHIWA